MSQNSFDDLEMYYDTFNITDNKADPVPQRLIALGRNKGTEHDARAILRCLRGCAARGGEAQLIMRLADGVDVCLVPPGWELEGGASRYGLLVRVAGGQASCLALIGPTAIGNWRTAVASVLADLGLIA